LKGFLFIILHLAQEFFIDIEMLPLRAEKGFEQEGIFIMPHDMCCDMMPP
jgi:hypothetical protein